MKDDINAANASTHGQKVAFATVSLVLGIASCIHMLGIEKAILAVVFGCLALKGKGGLKAGRERTWATVGIVLGGIMMVLVAVALIAFWPQVKTIVEALEKLS